MFTFIQHLMYLSLRKSAQNFPVLFAVLKLGVSTQKFVSCNTCGVGAGAAQELTFFFFYFAGSQLSAAMNENATLQR